MNKSKKEHLSQNLILSGLGSDAAASNSGGGPGKGRVGHSGNVLALTSDIELGHKLECFFDSRAREHLCVPGSEVGEFLLEVEVDGEEMVDGIVVIFDKGEISDGEFASNEPKEEV